MAQSWSFPRFLPVFWLFAAMPSQSYADIDRADPAAYGIGILTCPYAIPILGEECFRRLSWLEAPVKVYEGPSEDAAIVGTVLDPSEELRGWQPFHFWPASGRKSKLDTVEIAYEENAIVIHERRGGWLRSGQGWLKGEDVRLDASTAFLPWRTVLGYQMHGFLTEGRAYIGWLYPISNQSLHDGPHGKHLGRFWDSANREELPELLVLDRKENWIKVLVDDAGTTCGDRGQEPRGETGWVRLTNEAGNPLVYWFTRGC